MAKAIGGHSGLKSAMAMAIAAIPVAPPLRVSMQHMGHQMKTETDRWARSVNKGYISLRPTPNATCRSRTNKKLSCHIKTVRGTIYAVPHSLLVKSDALLDEKSYNFKDLQ